MVARVLFLLLTCEGNRSPPHPAGDHKGPPNPTSSALARTDHPAPCLTSRPVDAYWTPTRGVPAGQVSIASILSICIPREPLINTRSSLCSRCLSSSAAARLALSSSWLFSG